MTLVGLDLNTSRARAVRATTRTDRGMVVTPLRLDETGQSLPLALHLETRPARIGNFAANRVRQEPHLVCANFLPSLGQPRQWVGGRHRLDAGAALRLVFETLATPFVAAERDTVGVATTLPEYLAIPQISLLPGLTQKLRWKLIGSVPVSLAATLAVHHQLPWSGTVLVVDADDHALTCAAVILTHERITRLAGSFVEGLRTSAWLGRMLDGTAQRCIRLSRRDPRDCPEADQSLYLQLQRLIDKPPQGDDLLSLGLNTPHWAQHLMLHPGELITFCLPLIQQALNQIAEVHQTILAAPHAGPLAGVILTPTAAGLPGLRLALERSLQVPAAPVAPDDLGEGLLDNGSAVPGLTPRVHVLRPDDLAQAVAELADLFRAGRLAQGHRDTVPIVRPQVEDAGPARLQFQGRDYQLGRGVFTLGRNPECDLSFPSGQYPCVSTHHCDILLDQRSYTLRDHSRHGTFVNERPVRQCLPLHSGDRIRLGPQGPVLQFIGRS